MIVFKLLLIAMVYVGAAIGLAWFLARQFQTPKAKVTTVVLTLLVFALIPTWDILPGRLYFNHLCETEGGLKIYKTVEGVEGFISEDPSVVRPSLEKYGYKYVEGSDATGKRVRYSLKRDGNLMREDVGEFRGRYVLQSSKGRRSWSIEKVEHIVFDRQFSERLAMHTQFYYPGNWLQIKNSPLLGGGEACPPFSQDRYEKFFLETLKPNK